MTLSRNGFALPAAPFFSPGVVGHCTFVTEPWDSMGQGIAITDFAPRLMVGTINAAVWFSAPTDSVV